ncbi:hypothetical protein AAY473_029789 [Plecturocebus cupreus]
MGAASGVGLGLSSIRQRGKASEDWPRECRREARLRGHSSLMRSAQASRSSGRVSNGHQVGGARLGAQTCAQTPLCAHLNQGPAVRQVYTGGFLGGYKPLTCISHLCSSRTLRSGGRKP